MLMHCAGNRSRPNRYHALFFKVAQARCLYPGFGCMNATIFLRKLGMMAECSWECVKHLARRTVCMCLPFPMRRTLSYLVSATIRGDMAIVTLRRRQSAANTTSIRARWRISRPAVHWREYCACALAEARQRASTAPLAIAIMGNGQQSFYFAQGVARPSETVRPLAPERRLLCVEARASVPPNEDAGAAWLEACPTVFTR